MEQETKTTPAVEVWRDIAGYEGLYQVSNLGRVRSLDRWQYNPVTATHKTFHAGHIMNGVVARHGYRMVGLRPESGKRKNCSVHRLVATTFIPNPDNLPEVNHKDQNPTNNCADNLEWCDRKYNANYADARERQRKAVSRPIEQLTLDGQHVAYYDSIKSLHRLTGGRFHSRNIRRACIGPNVTAYGYRWRFVDK